MIEKRKFKELDKTVKIDLCDNSKGVSTVASVSDDSGESAPDLTKKEYLKLIDHAKNNNSDLSSLNDKQKQVLEKSKINAHYNAHLIVNNLHSSKSPMSYKDISRNFFNNTLISVKRRRYEEAIGEVMLGNAFSILDKRNSQDINSKKINKSILNQSDIIKIYENVQRDDGNISNLSYTQRIYLQGSNSESYSSMKKFVNEALNNDTIKMKEFVDLSDIGAKESFEQGDYQLALAKNLIVCRLNL